MQTFKPQRSSWAVLLVVSAPLAAAGLIGLILNPGQWVWALACIVFALAIVGFNASARLVITTDAVELRRYGRLVWSTPRIGTEIKDGLAGDVAIIPAHILWHDGHKAGYVLKSWFSPETITKIRQALAP